MKRAVEIEINISDGETKYTRKYKYDNNLEMELVLRIIRKAIKSCLMDKFGFKQ